MFTSPRMLALAVAALGVAPVSAQQSKGQTPPEFEFKKVWNDGPASFEEMADKVVLLDFTATW